MGKNTVGTFYQPDFVFIDPEFLATLPHQEFVNGLAEVVKYGIIRDSNFFRLIERRYEKILQKDPELLERIIKKCVRMKIEIVKKDEKM